MINPLGMCFGCQRRQATAHVAWFGICLICLQHTHEWEIRLVWARLMQSKGRA